MRRACRTTGAVISAPTPRRAAVLGSPIEHSLSPVLHRAAYTELGLDWSYTAIDCDAQLLPQLVQQATAEGGWAGFSVTMPGKQAAYDVAVGRSEQAELVGAANTLLPRPDGSWWATNTDVDGIVAALEEYQLCPANVTLLGAGATAQAALVALAQIGLRSVTVLLRDPVRAGRLAQCADTLAVHLEVERLVAGASATSAWDADLMVSTLPPRAADPYSDHKWRRGQTLLDVAYAPWPSALAGAAAASGAVVISGAVMLLHQAAEQVRLMTGQPAPIEAMRAALRQAAPGSGI